MPDSSDPYTYPGTNVLRNLQEIRDAEQFAALEAAATLRRLMEIRARPPKARFDVAHLKAIHKYIFQDLFSWACQFRTVNISKGGHMFGAAAFVEAALYDLLRKLAAE